MNTVLDHSAKRYARVAASLLVLCLAGCSPSTNDGAANDDVSSPGPASSPVLLIGLDGLEWDVVLELLDEGRMPHLQRLMTAGVFGDLETMVPTLSPIIWTTIATGKDPDEHGIRGFAHSSKDGKPGRLYSNLEREAKAFWNILTAFDRRVATVGWWVTYPVEPVNGVMVAQVNTATRAGIKKGTAIMKGGLVQGLDGQVHPPERHEEIFRQVAAAEAKLPAFTASLIDGDPEDLGPLEMRLWREVQWAFRADTAYEHIALELLATDDPYDVLAVYFGGTDVVGHNFWRHAYPGRYRHPPAPEQLALLGELLHRYYEYADHVIGRLTAAAPANATVIVVSDHGMVTHNQTSTFPADGLPRDVKSGWHDKAPAGVFVAAGAAIRPPTGTQARTHLERSDLRTVASIYDVVPTLLALGGVPVGRDMRGRVLDDLLAPAALDGRPVSYVRTHESLVEGLARRLGPTPSEDKQQDEQVERLEQLRALGYIE